MIIRRAETDPSTAIQELTRDIARLRSDLDNVRSALTNRGRRMLHDARGQLDTTTRAARSATGYLRQHPGAGAGILIGVAAVAVGVALAVSQTRRRG